MMGNGFFSSKNGASVLQIDNNTYSPITQDSRAYLAYHIGARSINN